MSSTPPSSLHLAVALDGAGWHPASWREPVSRPRDLFTAAYWADLVAEAERGLLDFVTIEDGLSPNADEIFRDLKNPEMASTWNRQAAIENCISAPFRLRPCGKNSVSGRVDRGSWRSMYGAAVVMARAPTHLMVE